LFKIIQHHGSLHKSAAGVIEISHPRPAGDAPSGHRVAINPAGTDIQAR